MADLCKYCFTGRLGGDAVVKTVNNKTLMEMSVAVNTGYGEYKKTRWHKITVWGDHVTNIVGIFKKGAFIAASGEPDANAWTDKDGNIKSEIQVRCQEVQLLSSKKDDSSNEQAPAQADPVY